MPKRDIDPRRTTPCALLDMATGLHGFSLKASSDETLLKAKARLERNQKYVDGSFPLQCWNRAIRQELSNRQA
jgi:hypothetical protein